MHLLGSWEVDLSRRLRPIKMVVILPVGLLKGIFIT